MKEQIEQMMEAPMKLVDNVTNELISAVRDTTRHMSTYPVLREEIDRIVRNIVIGTFVVKYGIHLTNDN